MKVSELVERLLQFEQGADLEISSGAGEKLVLGSVFDNTVDSAVYWSESEKLIHGKPATLVCIELDPEK